MLDSSRTWLILSYTSGTSERFASLHSENALIAGLYKFLGSGSDLLRFTERQIMPWFNYTVSFEIITESTKVMSHNEQKPY